MFLDTLCQIQGHRNSGVDLDREEEHTGQVFSP